MKREVGHIRGGFKFSAHYAMLPIEGFKLFAHYAPEAEQKLLGIII